MDNREEIRQAAARVLEKNKVLNGLMANPDFQDWLELVPKAELVYIQHKILTIDRSKPDWEKKLAELVIEYQAINRAIFTLTDERVKASEIARKKLTDLDTV